MSSSAVAALPSRLPVLVSSAIRIQALGVTRAEIRSRLEQGLWRRFGRAVVLHNGPLTRSQARAVSLDNAGPRALVTGFSALEVAGLEGWRRDAHHLLIPVGARVREVRGIQVVHHHLADWSTAAVDLRRPRFHDAAAAAVLAATTVTRSRVASAVLAAVVQQRITTVPAMRPLVEAGGNRRHRAAMLATLGDVEMGSEALSEIDFVQLCRENRLALPQRQAVRIEPGGRRRYLDAEWIRTDGRRVVVEVDGALHLQVRRWWDDQLRQNEVTLQDSIVLRYPSVVVRERDPVVADQLRRAGIVGSW